MSDRQVLFRTVHGSRLYGTANEDSDWDWYTVVTKKPVRNQFTQSSRHSQQHVGVDGEDNVIKDLGTWLMECQNGVPQALEAMFSQTPTIDLIGPLRQGYRATTGVWASYRRTMTNFAMHDDFKRQRHAVRLALNLRSIRATGRFNPRLHPDEVIFANAVASNIHKEDLVDFVRQLAFQVDHPVVSA